MSEVEMFADCLVEDGIDVMFAMAGIPFKSKMTVSICCVNWVCPYKVQIEER